MEALDTTASFMVGEDLLDFCFDAGDDTTDDKATTKDPSFSSLDSSRPFCHHTPLPEFGEEELEWLSNKDAFPAIDTCPGLLSEATGVVSDHLSPVSILEHSTSSSGSNSNGGGSTMSGSLSIGVPLQYPVRPRSKRRRRRRRGFPVLPPLQQFWWSSRGVVKERNSSLAKTNTGSIIGRRCQHCQADKTPQWRAGPMGPKTLCNACGVRYKSGRLWPEYRPASSPTFSIVLHSNSHRKVMEMRRQKQTTAITGNGLMMTTKDSANCGYSRGLDSGE